MWGTASGRGPSSLAAEHGPDTLRPPARAVSKGAAGCWEPADAGKGEEGRERKLAAGVVAKGGESEGEGRDSWYPRDAARPGEFSGVRAL